MADARVSALPHHVGLLIPSSNTTIEHEYNRFGPPEIIWHVGRLTLTEVSLSGVSAQEPDILSETHKLATARPGAILLCQSAIGFVAGQDAEHAITAQVTAAAGVTALSAASLMVAAVKALGAKRIALATPFASGVDAAATGYFTRAGFPPFRSQALGMTGNYPIASITAEQLIALIRAVDAAEVDAIVMPGGNLQAMRLLPEIEAALGKPVVITNQACIWAVAGLLGIAVGPALGRLAHTDVDFLLRRSLR